MNCLKRTVFNYQSPSNLYKKLSETENAEKNKTKSDLIKKVLTKSKKKPLKRHLDMMYLKLKTTKK